MSQVNPRESQHKQQQEQRMKDINELVEQESDNDYIISHEANTVGLWIFLSIGLICATSIINLLIYAYCIL